MVGTLSLTRNHLPIHSPPFDATNQIALAMKIRAGKTTRIPSAFSEDLWKVIRYMLQVEVRKPSIAASTIDLESISENEPTWGRGSQTLEPGHYDVVVTIVRSEYEK